MIPLTGDAFWANILVGKTKKIERLKIKVSAMKRLVGFQTRRIRDLEERLYHAGRQNPWTGQYRNLQAELDKSVARELEWTRRAEAAEAKLRDGG